MSGWPDAVRLSVGTLTVLPVRPPTDVGRRTAGRAMALAPVVGLALGAAGACVLLLGRWAFHDPRLPAALTIGFLALATRGIHLDGLADTADGLGASRLGRQRALEVMRQGDVGPFGVVTLVLVLGVQTLALGEAVAVGHGTEAVLTACVVGRLAATWGCVRGVPAAQRDGLGAQVAGTVSRATAGVITVVALAAAATYGGVVDDDASGHLALLGVLSVVVGLALAGVVLGRCVRRFGGITGDVLGALVEVGVLGTLLVLAR